MKHVKKLLSAVLVLVLALTMVLPVAAEGETQTYSITINNDKPNHTYEAYQIFTGDLSGDVLSNIAWGSGVTKVGQDALGSASEKAASITTEAIAKEFARTLDDNSYLQNPKSTSTQTNGKYVIDGLAPGYYLVKDANGSMNGKEEDAYTAYILKVVKNVEATPKSSVPSVDKQVEDEKADAENSDGWGETADHEINESFQFKLTATLPEDIDIANYKEYQVVFTDTMSNGITFESIDSVTIGGTSTDSYTCDATEGQAGGIWHLTIADIKEVLGENYNYNQEIKVEVVYNAHLNEYAEVNKTSGGTTNNNKVGLEYSNNPNGTGTGKTPEDYVWVFTYEVDNSKVDENGQPLKGAGFKLYAADADGKITGTEIKVVKTETPGEYRLAKTGEAGVEMKTEEIDGKVQNKFNIKGLDAGTYFLKETTTPDGYNTCPDFKVVISATHSEADDGTATTTIDQENSNMNNTIENNKGTTLPGTGGIGTTIFYVVGGILVVGAAVLLIAKKRTKM